MAEEKKEKAKKEEGKKVKQPTPRKRDIQHEKQRLRNRAFKSKVGTAIRHLETNLQKKDENLTKKSLNEVFSLMDKGVKRGIYKLNKASRTKSRLTAKATSRA